MEFNLENERRKNTKEMAENSKKRGFLSKIKKVREFFKSESWDKLHDVSNYKVAGSLSEEILEQEVQIYDKGQFIYGLYNLTEEEKQNLDKIDEEKLEDIFIDGKSIFFHIGTCTRFDAIVELSKN